MSASIPIVIPQENFFFQCKKKFFDAQYISRGGEEGPIHLYASDLKTRLRAKKKNFFTAPFNYTLKICDPTKKNFFLMWMTPVRNYMRFTWQPPVFI